jgi:ribosome-associated protein
MSRPVRDGLLVVGDRLRIPLAEVDVRASRSSGPGGQHANVTASRIEASFDVEASRSLSDHQRRRLLDRCGARVTAVAQDARGQARNRALALERLAVKIERGLETRRKRRRTKPGRAARERRLQAKRRRSAIKANRRKPDLDS